MRPSQSATKLSSVAVFLLLAAVVVSLVQKQWESGLAILTSIEVRLKEQKDVLRDLQEYKEYVADTAARWGILSIFLVFSAISFWGAALWRCETSYRAVLATVILLAVYAVLQLSVV